MSVYPLHNVICLCAWKHPLHPIVYNMLTMPVNDQFVHSPWSQCGSDCIDNAQACCNVAQDLRLALWSVCSLLQEDDRCLLDEGRGSVFSLIRATVWYIEQNLLYCVWCRCGWVRMHTNTGVQHLKELAWRPNYHKVSQTTSASTHHRNGQWREIQKVHYTCHRTWVTYVQQIRYIHMSMTSLHSEIHWWCAPLCAHPPVRWTVWFIFSHGTYRN